MCEWKLNLHWSETPSPDDKPHATTRAEIVVNVNYLYATVTIFPEMLEMWKQKEFRSIGEALLHEVCHILTTRLWNWAKYDARPSQLEDISTENENLVQRIANAMSVALPSGWWELDKKKGR